MDRGTWNRPATHGMIRPMPTSKLIEVRNSPIHGRGVFARTDIPAGEQIVEYKGKRLTHEEADRRFADNLDGGHTFLFTLNDKFLIDGNDGGSAARWINHSCAPNCEAMIYVNKDYDEIRDKVWIEALRPISAGEELTYNYGIVLTIPHTRRLKQIWVCRCGSPQCSGTLLQPKPKAKARTPYKR